MSRVLVKKLSHVRSTRDLRAEILDLASHAIAARRLARLDVIAPSISEQRVREEWDRVMPALHADAPALLSLRIQEEASPSNRSTISLAKPNYRFEVLRQLVDASLQRRGPPTLAGLLDCIGASQTPIRSALVALQAAELIATTRRPEINPSALSVDVLGRVSALPQTLRFRFERGAQIKAPPHLLNRACALLSDTGPAAWKGFALSGTAAAALSMPNIDLAGIPRLDLVLHVPRDGEPLDSRLMRRLDDGLEVEPNVLAPTPVVVTIVRTKRFDAHPLAQPSIRCASHADVLLSLLDIGLRDQAIRYAEFLRQSAPSRAPTKARAISPMRRT